MRRIKNWLVAAGIAIAGLFGYHAQLSPTQTIEVKAPAPVVAPITGIPGKLDPRIVITCDDTCTIDEEAELQPLVDKLILVESSKCFSDYFAKNVDPNQLNGLMESEAITLITTSRVSTKLSYYYQARNWFTKTLVIGYENGDGLIHANRAAWDYMNDCEKIGNLAHELSHGEPMNFSHDFNQTAARPYSAPYVIGDAATACCNNK